MLVHIPEGGGKATAVSLPRDTWIGPRVTTEITGPYPDGSQGEYNPNKINSFYSTAKAYTEEALVSQGVTDEAERERLSNEAGRTMLIRVVQAFTGMKIDHYAEVNLLGFYLLSNAIGGVPVCLNAAVERPVVGRRSSPPARRRCRAPPPCRSSGSGTACRTATWTGSSGSRRSWPAPSDKILSVGTLTDPGRLSDLVNAVDRIDRSSTRTSRC